MSLILAQLLQTLTEFRLNLEAQSETAIRQAQDDGTPDTDRLRLSAVHDTLIDVNRELVQAVAQIVSQPPPPPARNPSERLAQDVEQLRAVYLDVSADIRAALTMPGLNDGQRAVLELLAHSYAEHNLHLLMILETRAASPEQAKPIFTTIRRGMNALIGGLLPPSSSVVQ